MSNDFFKMRGIVKQYQMGNEVQTILKGIDLDIEEGEFLSILGPSGSGKSTLMNIIGCLDTADEGTYYLDGQKIDDYSEDELADIRGRKIGFIFQQFNLLPKLTAQENVELPLIYQGMSASKRHARSEEVLKRVGLLDRMDHKPTELSGGQQQRVAIARALALGVTEYFGVPFLTPGSEFDAEAAGENGYMALRSFPQTDAEVLAQIPNGTAVTVLGDFNGWYTVRAGDLYGFASIAEVQLGVMPLGE